MKPVTTRGEARSLHGERYGIWENEMNTFRYKKSIRASYKRQGHIFFTMQNLHQLSEAKREKLHKICDEVAGEYSEALWAYLTTEKGHVAICMEFNLSQDTLFRVRKRFYESFPENL